MPNAAVLALCLLAPPSAAGAAAGSATKPAERPRRIFAHYMGCYPALAKATAYHRAQVHKCRHDGATTFDKFDKLGSRWRNWPLGPGGTRLSVEESAELELRRAVRAGIDGFAVDAWAGGDDPKEVLTALLTVARDKGIPVDSTICLDPTCLAGSGGKRKAAAEAVRWLLDNHGDNPRLARRDGKPLIFGYQSLWPGVGYGSDVLGRKPEFQGREDIWKSPELRTTPAGWRLFGEAYDEIARKAGRGVFFHFGMGAFFHGVAGKHLRNRDELRVRAAGVLGRHFGAVGEFLGGGEVYDRMADAVRAAGAEWSEPMWFQYENIHTGHNRIGRGTAILRGRWERARANRATLIQFVTWNDYTENTCLAPGYETRYAVMDLNAWFIRWWKAGRAPKPDRDRVYLFYRKAPKDAETWPFRTRRRDAGCLEIATLLTAPAIVRAPGRDAEWQAPAGLHVKQLPVVPGPVVAEVVRGGRAVVALTAPEPITARPYREQNGLTAYSTEFERHWRADFPDAAPEHFAEYADADGDGLPNWFEMYWFGKFLDWSTATGARPDADPDGDGKTNIQEHQARTDPTCPPIPTVP